MPPKHAVAAHGDDTFNAVLEAFRKVAADAREDSATVLAELLLERIVASAIAGAAQLDGIAARMLKSLATLRPVTPELLSTLNTIRESIVTAQENVEESRAAATIKDLREEALEAKYPAGDLAARRGEADFAAEVRTIERDLMIRANTHFRDELAAAMEEDFDELREAIERHAYRATLESGLIGHRRYAPGQVLVVYTNGEWRDAVVADVPTAGIDDKGWSWAAPTALLMGRPGDSALSSGIGGLGGSTLHLHLHPWNHAPSLMWGASFEDLLLRHERALRASHASIVDALSGRRLDVHDQCVPIEVSTGHAATARMHRYVWSWKTKDSGERQAAMKINPGGVVGEFVEYPAEVCAVLDEKYHAYVTDDGDSFINLEAGAIQPLTAPAVGRKRPPNAGEGALYAVDLEAMEQYNMKSGFARPVRKRERPGGGGADAKADSCDALEAVADVSGLGAWLHAAHTRRMAGDASAKACILLTAPPAAGKTCLMSQLVMHTLRELRTPLDERHSGLVPIVCKVQHLQKKLLDEAQRPVFARAWNFVDAYLRCVHGEDSPHYRMLRQAMMCRRALLLLDGLDEGGKARAEIEKHVTEVLAPQGHVMLVTSRPAGLNDRLFEPHFHRLQLRPLTDAQQRQVIEQRLGAGPQADALGKYVREKVPIDSVENVRVTGNPLMLSMVISIFESAARSSSGSSSSSGRGGSSAPSHRR